MNEAAAVLASFIARRDASSMEALLRSELPTSKIEMRETSNPPFMCLNHFFVVSHPLRMAPCLVFIHVFEWLGPGNKPTRLLGLAHVTGEPMRIDRANQDIVGSMPVARSLDVSQFLN